ncbi:outer membrane beta-barrel protein [Aliiglaciecola sp. 2_MG-2023]|uniref:outer membrane beta-barrel protein n=1 Tax=unclassified Aliiglaciecola TaxID=2593648 RepID=UPI0026E4374A|nr:MULTISPECIES: outer membrane beta-barrel protein [unclassified Aliiglaciecola]MDO6712189.1 outer membrane beta-barrel protein [Aliiglaciecola sp. 2_MG-2023]MDO6753573.1 outer membrane beta-barrel protein [Aliiglaciecola sp. 1_MG-2023]
MNSLFCADDIFSNKDYGMHYFKLAVASATLVFQANVVAQQQQAGSIDLGGFELIPSIEVTYALDDNVTNAASDEIDSWKSTFVPELLLLNNFGNNVVQFGYRLERGDYYSSSEDNYTDHFVSAMLDLELNSRHRVSTTIEYEDGHDARGTVYSIGAGNDLASIDTYKGLDGDLVYSYGGLTASARIDFRLAYRDLDYDRSEESYLARDRDFKTIGSTFYYKIASATDMVIDYSRTDVTYQYTPVGSESFDSTNSSILVGLQWDSTAATSGYAKIGYQEKDFDSQQRDKFSGVDWALGVVWQPIDRSNFEFSTKSDTDETNGEGNFIERRTYLARWQHDWLDRLSSEAYYSYIDDSYEGSVNSRKDEINRLTLAAKYQFRRWLTIDLSYQYDERSSNQDTIDYDKNLISIGFTATL